MELASLNKVKYRLDRLGWQYEVMRGLSEKYDFCRVHWPYLEQTEEW